MMKLTHNPGQIIEINGWPKWQTQVGPFNLKLDIVVAGQTETGEQVGIASFVVMEQNQSFLTYVGKQLATAIAKTILRKQLLLLTAESKGSHFIPWVWQHLSALYDDRLEQRVIILRKGEMKAYMQRPVRMDEQVIWLPQVNYHSITSTTSQQLTMSPRDVELLLRVVPDATIVFVDDFIGQGGTVVAVSRLLGQLGVVSPQHVAAIGCDGNLYIDALTQAGIEVTLLPHPFPLVLPTFRRLTPDQPWMIVS